MRCSSWLGLVPLVLPFLVAPAFAQEESATVTLEVSGCEEAWAQVETVASLLRVELIGVGAAIEFASDSPALDSSAPDSSAPDPSAAADTLRVQMESCTDPVAITVRRRDVERVRAVDLSDVAESARARTVALVLTDLWVDAGRTATDPTGLAVSDSSADAAVSDAALLDAALSDDEPRVAAEGATTVPPNETALIAGVALGDHTVERPSELSIPSNGTALPFLFRVGIGGAVEGGATLLGGGTMAAMLRPRTLPVYAELRADVLVGWVDDPLGQIQTLVVRGVGTVGAFLEAGLFFFSGGAGIRAGAVIAEASARGEASASSDQGAVVDALVDVGAGVKLPAGFDVSLGATAAFTLQGFRGLADERRIFDYSGAHAQGRLLVSFTM